MREAAANLDFETAAALRDEIAAAKARDLGLPRAGRARDRVLTVVIEWLKRRSSRCRSTRSWPGRRRAAR